MSGRRAALAPLPPLLACLALGCTLLRPPPPDAETPATRPTAAEAGTAPTLEELANATYSGVFETPVALRGGEWDGPPLEPGGPAGPHVSLLRGFRLVGDLDGDGRPEATIVLSENAGGSGRFDHLVVVGRRGDGSIVTRASAPLGDRVQIRGGAIQDGHIVIDVLQAGPGDALCCPSQKVRRAFTLDETGLSEGTPDDSGAIGIGDLSGTEWRLTHFDWDDPAPDEPLVTLRFDGSHLSGSSGCNRYSTFVEMGERPLELRVGPIAATRRMCGAAEMAVEDRFLAALSSVERLGFAGGRLSLGYASDESYHTLLLAPRER